MSERVVFKDIKVKIAPEELLLYMGRPVGHVKLDKYLPVLETVARPKAIVKWVDSDYIDETHVSIDGHVFESRILADKLKGIYRVVVYVITAGTEIKETDEIHSDAIKDMFATALLGYGFKEVNEYLQKELHLEGLTVVTAGSLPDWPVINNLEVSKILGDVNEIGITMQDNGFMTPWNTSMGIMFTGTPGYLNCTFCDRENCVTRSAPFDPKERDRLFNK